MQPHHVRDVTVRHGWPLPRDPSNGLGVIFRWVEDALIRPANQPDLVADDFGVGTKADSEAQHQG